MKGELYMQFELNNDQIYGSFQLENWWNTLNEQVFEISGAAGTGKTTLIRYFIDRIGLRLDEVLFVAYMGKAVTQMMRNGLPAQTIHSSIYDFEEVFARDPETHKIIFKKNGKPKKRPEFVLKDHLPKRIKLIVIDESGMVNEEHGRNLLSFGLPVVALGDLNQLPPVFGNSFFLQKPNVILKQIMRQEEGNPVIWLSQQILEGNRLKPGVYGNSAVLKKEDMNDFHFKHADIILTSTNRLRYNVNNYYRENIKGIKIKEYPHLGEKVICRKNNRSHFITEGDNTFYLTNGTTGFVETIDRSSFDKKTMTMDFRPDFSKKSFHNITFDYNHLYAIPGDDEEGMGFYYDRMEFAYAITVHSSQGSQWPHVLFLPEMITSNREELKKIWYTAITRASESVTIVLPD